MRPIICSTYAHCQNVDVEDEVVFVKEKCVQARDLLDRTFMRLNLVCNTMIELPYNSAGYDNICIHCGDQDKKV